MTNQAPLRRSRAQWLGLAAGPVAAGLLLAGAHGWGPVLDAQQPQLNQVAAVAVLMAIWWMTEALPLAVTALVPIVALPALRIAPAAAVAPNYADPLILLFLGGFLVALSIEQSGLHRRLALTIVSLMGDRPRGIVLGFMVATAVLSMWLSNTATTLMLLPIATSVLKQVEQTSGRPPPPAFSAALLLGVAYSASIGGIGTLIGTPTNVYFRGFFQKQFPELGEVTFGGWMLLAVPFVAAFLLSAWLAMVLGIFRFSNEPLLGGRGVIATQLRGLGPMTPAECRMSIIFATTALLWILREPVEGWGWAPLLGLGKQSASGQAFSWVDDGTVGILMAIVCFICPSGRASGDTLLSWRSVAAAPWDVLLLFGGGLALAFGMSASGLDKYLGYRLAEVLHGMPPLLRMAAVAAAVTCLTELTSNVSCLQMVLPILAKAAGPLQVDPRILMVPATISASCAFMLPVATPPNAIVYGTGYFRIGEMVKAGIWLNVVGVILTVLFVWLLRGAVLAGG
jgi:sodium-dependent dicarboxylate transporter 2/3/5